jgi:hypothetical protein
MKPLKDFCDGVGTAAVFIFFFIGVAVTIVLGMIAAICKFLTTFLLMWGGHVAIAVGLVVAALIVAGCEAKPKFDNEFINLSHPIWKRDAPPAAKGLPPIEEIDLGRPVWRR